MHRIPFVFFGLAAVPVALVGLSVGADDAPAVASSFCSLQPFPVGRNPQTTYFVAEATADSIFTGPGLIEPTEAGGHWGSGQVRLIYGQVVRVEILAGYGATGTSLANAVKRGTDVVVVPWDYDEACRPTYWQSSALWVSPGEESFYKVQLRPESEWLNGAPTFDALFADIAAYPHGAFYENGFRGTAALMERESLTPRELFSLYGILPTQDDLNRPTVIRRQIMNWVESNSELAKRYPADDILERLRRRIGPL